MKTTFYCCQGVQCPLHGRCSEFAHCKTAGCNLRDTCYASHAACRWCPIYCRDRPQAAETLLALLADYDVLRECPIPNTIPAELPLFVPAMMTALGPGPLPLAYTATTIWRLFRRERSWAMDMKAWLKLTPSTSVMMSFYTKDPALEYLWRRRDTRVIQLIENSSIDVIISPDFSIYDDEPAFFNIYEYVRGELLYAALAPAAKPVAYNVRWLTGQRTLLDKAITFINEYNLPLISINVRIGGDTPGRWRLLKDDLAYLAARISPQTHTIFWGLHSARRIRFIMEHFENITIVHARAAILAARYRGIDDKVVIGVSQSPADLFLANVDAYNELYAQIREGVNLG